MRILYLCQRIPFPPDRGDRIPVYHQIKRLSKTHEVVVGSLAHPSTRRNADALKNELGIKVIAPDHSRFLQAKELTLAFLKGKPLSLGYFRNPRLQSLIDTELSQKHFDAIIVFSSSMASYVEPYGHIPKIMHFCDVDSQKWSSMADNAHGLHRWIYQREGRTLLEYERKIAAQFEISCVVSQNEADLFRKHIPRIPVQVIENGVDIDYFSAVQRNCEELKIIFVGVMDYTPNIEAVSFFVTRVWQKIRSAYPHARFIIVGAKPTRQVQNLAKIPGVEVTRYITDIRPYLSAATLSIAPLAIARGVQNKILEALASEVPVLTTPEVAKGLPDGVEKLVFTAERKAEPFASALIELLKNPEVLKITAAKGREFVRQNCTWDVKLKKLDDLLSQTEQTSQQL
jgi:sugar transferase (PEP-CTERM/EpsH1 system associated)